MKERFERFIIDYSEPAVREQPHSNERQVQAATGVCMLIFNPRPIAAMAVALYMVALATPANARCVCRCINGQVQGVCDSAIDIPPICAPQICPMTSPSIAPIPKPTIPPLGTTSCRQVQVLNSRTNQYEWRQVCQ